MTEIVFSKTQGITNINFMEKQQVLYVYIDISNMFADKKVYVYVTLFLVDLLCDHCVTGIYQFVRPHHKKRFDERCQELTGQGCGYIPNHSLAKHKNKELLLHSGMGLPGCLHMVESSCYIIS